MMSRRGVLELKMRILPYAAAVLALSVLGASTAARAVDGEGPILPGYWESTSKASFPLSSSKTERKCISARAINAYLTGPVNSHYACHYDTRRLQDGHAEMAGECIDNNGLKSKIKIDGDYAPEKFNLNGHLKVVIGGLGIPIETSIDAHRLSAECPAGMKVEDGGDGRGPQRRKGDG
jgi:hypothetical protein